MTNDAIVLKNKTAEIPEFTGPKNMGEYAKKGQQNFTLFREATKEFVSKYAQ